MGNPARNGFVPSCEGSRCRRYALYEDTNIKVFPWDYGYLLVSRGVYQGITDVNGAWVVRSVSEQELNTPAISEWE